ncbi:MAG: divergent PAP2 family protein [Provencibacterium sp.]|jgi:acid phosphatase family membrane protein YuiD|nr:divergent PAP2 family protein [Provencibacterium sp.]
MLGLLTSNYLINVGFLAWISAQVAKTILHYLVTGRWVSERMFGAGGMPSSHSALVCSITIGMVRKMGFDSPEFALALTLAAVVMYDAMGVRRAAGEHAKVINKLMFGFQFLDLTRLAQEDEEEEQKLIDPEQEKLKEFLGHTPFEVLGGALLGILIAMIVPVK